MAHNLIVDEEYIREEAANIRNALVAMDVILNHYTKVLEDVCHDGIKDGPTADALKSFTFCAKTLKGKMDMTGRNIDSLMNNYLLAIDDADQYLF